jgi:hypothetical protein
MNRFDYLQASHSRTSSCAGHEKLMFADTQPTLDHLEDSVVDWQSVYVLPQFVKSTPFEHALRHKIEIGGKATCVDSVIDMRARPVTFCSARILTAWTFMTKLLLMTGTAILLTPHIAELRRQDCSGGNGDTCDSRKGTPQVLMEKNSHVEDLDEINSWRTGQQTALVASLVRSSRH